MKLEILLDTIHLNFIEEIDQEVLMSSSRQLETYKYYKKISKLFDFFGWEKKDFNLQRLSQRFKKQYSNGAYVEIKTFSLKNEKSNPEKKLISIQLKSIFFLESGYLKLQELLKLDSEFNFSVSKCEVAIDTNIEYVEESMKKMLDHRTDFVSMKNPDYIFNFNNQCYESIHIENTVNVLKVYQKTQELKLNKKKEDLYFEKSSFKKTDVITRLEIGFKTSANIKQSIKEEILSLSESEITSKIIKSYFSKIQVLKRSTLKKVIELTLTI